MMFACSILLSFPLIAYAASGQGSVSLWSDSGCNVDSETSNFGQRDPLALNYTLSADVCGTFGGTAHSYIVNEHPTCDNGTLAAFAFYSSPGCSQAPFDTPAGPAMNEWFPTTQFDGECLALVAFNSVAFVCDGPGLGGQGAGSASASVASSTPATTPTFSTTPLASATPIAPGVTPTAPIYTNPAGSLSATPVPSSSGASTGALSQPSNPSTPSQVFFTGAASERGGSLIGVMAALGAALVI